MTPGTGLPTVSVAIPTFDRAGFLPRVLASVLGQTHPPHEVILVDDGSTDGTPAVVEGLLAAHPEWRSRLRYHRQENQGKSVAVNAAIARATGEWIAFDDSDDLWRPRKLELQLRLLAENPDCRVCFSDSLFVNDPRMAMTSFERARKRYPGESGRIEDPVRFICNPPHGVFVQTIVARADLLHEVGPFDPRFRVSQDTDYLFRLALRSRFCFVNEPLVEIDRTPVRDQGLTTHTGRGSRVRLETYRLIYDGWTELATGLDPDIRRSIRRLSRSIRNELATWHARNGDPRAARALLAELLASGFSAKIALKWLALRIAPGRVGRRLGTPPR